MDKEMEQEKIAFQVRENRAALVCGVLAIGFVTFILIMWMIHPSGRGGGVFLFVPLFIMAVAGVLFLVMYFHKKVTVDEMNICYVNWFGKEKRFTLDEIGFCKLGVGGSQSALTLYDLLGKKLCKLETSMRGFAQFHQYLVDNKVKVEWNRDRLDSQAAYLIDAIQCETAVCEEEIRKCSEKFYEQIEPVFRDWERRNKKFGVHWEIGFAQYMASDLEKKCRLWARRSSLEEPLEAIPASYECLLEAYLKSGDEYVVNSKGEGVYIMLPYLVRSKSYQIGERTRIRKADEQNMTEWLAGQLEILAGELPKHRYHTEKIILCHTLRQTAGITDNAAARPPVSLAPDTIKNSVRDIR